MIHSIYTIYDVKAKVYNRPFYLVNDQVAIRGCADLVNDKTSDIGKHPEDFILFRIGTFDDLSASFDLDKDPVTILRFHEIQGLLPNV